jgi:hypothetical protein
VVENTLGVLHNITKNLENIRKHLKKRAGNPHFRSHPVAMLLPVMRNGTFCTTTIVRKKRGEKSGHAQNILLWLTSHSVTSLQVLWRHFRIDSISFTSFSKYYNFFHKPQRLKNTTLLVFPMDDFIKTFHFPVIFQTATFEMQRYLFSAYRFPVFFQNTTFEMQRYLFSVYHLPVLFQK